MSLKLTIIVAIIMVTANLSCAAPKIKSTTVTEFNIDRYLGLWYEIARFDHRFERDMECVTAQYSLREDGKIRVENRGYNIVEKEWSSAIGKAKFTDEIGRLKVSFFLFFYGDYNILALGESSATAPYDWALVGSRTDKYLWILSRTPSITPKTLEYIKNIATSKGYDVENLIYINHNCQ